MSCGHTSKNVGPLRALLDLKAPAFVPVTINASGNSQTDLANKNQKLLKSSQVAHYLQPRLPPIHARTHPPQAPERCQANLLYCETRKLQMRNTAQIWWAQASKQQGDQRCYSVAFSSQASESGSLLFRTKRRRWQCGMQVEASRLLHLRRITATVPKHRERDIYHHGPPIPQQAYATLARKWATHKSLATSHRPLDTSSDLRYLQLLRSIIIPTARPCVLRALRPPVALFKVGCR